MIVARRSTPSDGVLLPITLLRAAAAGALLTVAFMPLAHAAEDAATKEAKGHFAKAEVSYKLGRFEEALVSYETAYAAKALPEILFNVGQCHKALGRHKEAIFFFEGYLRGRPEAANRPLVESLIAESRVRLEEREREERARLEAEAARARAAAEAEARRLDASARAAGALTPPAAVPPPASTPAWKRWWFWTIVGGLALAAGGGVAAGLSLRVELVPPAGSLGTIDRRD